MGVGHFIPKDSDMSDSHHTKEQVRAAFARAPEILEQMIAAGCRLPRFELFIDGSGRIALGDEAVVTDEQLRLAQRLLRSTRPYETMCPICMQAIMFGGKPKPHTHTVGVTFCCGLASDRTRVDRLSGLAHIKADHVDGPLLVRRDGRLHWLSLWERLLVWAGCLDAAAIDAKLTRREAIRRGR